MVLERWLIALICSLCSIKMDYHCGVSLFIAIGELLFYLFIGIVYMHV